MEEIETFQVFPVQRLDNALHLVTWFTRYYPYFFAFLLIVHVDNVR